MTEKQNILYTAIICTMISMLVYWDTTSYPTVQEQGFGQGPGFYPKLLVCGLFILSLFPVLRLFVKKSTIPPAENPDAGETAATKFRPALPYLILLLTIAFILSLPILGFIPGGFILATLTALFIRGKVTLRTIMFSILAGILIIFMVWLVFSFSIGIELPPSHIF